MPANLILNFDTIEPFTIKLNDFLSSRGIVPGDLTDVIFAAKASIGDIDADSLVSKTLQGGGIVMGVDGNGGDTMAVTFAYTDYGATGLERGKSYFIGVGFKTATHTKWLEGKWAAGTPRLEIAQDFFRE